MTILITGANRGLGYETARQYAEAEKSVIGTTRGEIPDTLADMVAWHQLDVRAPETIAQLSQDLDGCELDLLICNAGIYPDKQEQLDGGFPPEMWAEVFAVNVTGVFLTVQALLPNLRAARKARIAVIASLMGSSACAAGGSYIYRASKAAAVNLTRNLARDLAPEGISVGAYHPGWVSTDMGGATAPIAPKDAAAGLIRRFAALTPDNTGCFESFDGTTLPF